MMIWSLSVLMSNILGDFSMNYISCSTGSNSFSVRYNWYLF